MHTTLVVRAAFSRRYMPMAEARLSENVGSTLYVENLLKF